MLFAVKLYGDLPAGDSFAFRIPFQLDNRISFSNESKVEKFDLGDYRGALSETDRFLEVTISGILTKDDTLLELKKMLLSLAIAQLSLGRSIIIKSEVLGPKYYNSPLPLQDNSPLFHEAKRMGWVAIDGELEFSQPSYYAEKSRLLAIVPGALTATISSPANSFMSNLLKTRESIPHLPSNFDLVMASLEVFGSSGLLNSPSSMFLNRVIALERLSNSMSEQTCSEVQEIIRKLPCQGDSSKVEFSRNSCWRKSAGGSPPSASCGRRSL